MLRAWVKHFRTTSVITLLHPTPKVVALFDQVFVLRKGRFIFQGIPRAVSKFLNCENGNFDMCIQMPFRVGEADFVLASMQMSTERTCLRMSSFAPLSPSTSLSAASSLSSRDQKAVAPASYTSGHCIIASPSSAASSLSPISSLQSPQPSWTLHETRLSSTHASFSSFLSILHREATLTYRDTSLLVARLLRALTLGLITGFIFFQSTKFGALIHSILILPFQTTALLSSIFHARSLFYKQQKAGFFACSPVLLASTLVCISVVVVESLIFGSIVYFCAGFHTEKEGGKEIGKASWWCGENFGIFLVNLITAGCAMTALHRGAAYICPSAAMTPAIGVVFVFSFILFSGFIVSWPVMKDSIGWIMWVNPIFYCYQGRDRGLLCPPNIDFPSHPCIFSILILLTIPCNTNLSYFLRPIKQLLQPTSLFSALDTSPSFLALLLPRSDTLCCSSAGYSSPPLGDGEVRL